MSTCSSVSTLMIKYKIMFGKVWINIFCCVLNTAKIHFVECKARMDIILLESDTLYQDGVHKMIGERMRMFRSEHQLIATKFISHRIDKYVI